MLKITAWRASPKQEKTCTYRLQIDAKLSKTLENQLHQTMIGWNEAGRGFNLKSAETTLIYSKEFNSKQEWIKWSKAFPHDIYELTKTKTVLIKANKKQKIDLKNDVLKIQKKSKKQKTCGRCGSTGHNKRTCKKKGKQT
jgi:hypothetical protein